MGVKVAATCLQWSQPVIPRSLSSSQALASAVSSPSSRQRRRGDGKSLSYRYVHTLDRSGLLGSPLTKLHRSRSCEYLKQENATIRRVCSASLDAFSDEEFSKQIQDLALKFQLSSDNDEARESSDLNPMNSDSEEVSDSCQGDASNSEDGYSRFSEEFSQIISSVNFLQNQSQFRPSQLVSLEPPWREIPPEPSDWPVRDEMISEDIERKANSVDLPLSLRIIKRKIQWDEGFREAGESVYCSVKKAFSSMVFMIQELHSYTLQLRELLYYEDLQGILVRVQKEMQASFVWLFQQVFSHTPTLMVYVMILLANFTVYSMGHHSAMAASPPPASYVSTMTASSFVQIPDQKSHKFDSSTIRTFSVSSSNGKTASVGGNNGGGGKVRPVSSSTDGDGWINGSDHYRTVVPDGASQLTSLGSTRERESVSKISQEEEVTLWNSIVREASEMESSTRDEALDLETMRRFVSPVTARIEQDDQADYLRTELLYQTGVGQEPNNPLLLANYAQFLYLVAHDYDRAEEYFKRATKVEPADAEAYSKYATFLWKVRNDLWAAEETFLEAISADPSNSYYAANYANFLWNTGGEDTCFPLSSDADTSLEEA